MLYLFLDYLYSVHPRLEVRKAIVHSFSSTDMTHEGVIVNDTLVML